MELIYHLLRPGWRKNLLKHGIQGRKQCKKGLDWWPAQNDLSSQGHHNHWEVYVVTILKLLFQTGAAVQGRGTWSKLLGTQ